MRANKLKPVDVAKESGLSRQQLLRLRMGRQTPRLLTAMRIRDACGRLLVRYVQIAEVFEVD